MLVVPGTGSGSKAFMRLSYCVDTETCEKSIPIFKEMMEKHTANSIRSVCKY